MSTAPLGWKSDRQDWKSDRQEIQVALQEVERRLARSIVCDEGRYSTTDEEGKVRYLRRTGMVEPEEIWFLRTDADRGVFLRDFDKLADALGFL